MKTLLSALLALGLALIGATASAQTAMKPPAPEGWRVIETQLSYLDLNSRLDAAIEAERMVLVNQASASDGAARQGVTILGNRVVGVFRNDFARRLLPLSLAAGIEAPIRFYVVEEPFGPATLSYRLPSAVLAPYVAEGGRDLEALAVELDDIFAAIAKRATGGQ